MAYSGYLLFLGMIKPFPCTPSFLPLLYSPSSILLLIKFCFTQISYVLTNSSLIDLNFLLFGLRNNSIRCIYLFSV